MNWLSYVAGALTSWACCFVPGLIMAALLVVLADPENRAEITRWQAAKREQERFKHG